MENKELAHDLMNSRELNSRLEQNKEDLMRQLTGKELDFEQMQIFFMSTNNNSEFFIIFYFFY